jgi:hypothetical protein
LDWRVFGNLWTKGEGALRLIPTPKTQIGIGYLKKKILESLINQSYKEFSPIS